MKRILLLCFLLIIVFTGSTSTQVESAVNTQVLFEFDKGSYYENEIIHLTIHVYNFQALFGFQVDIMEDTPVFSIPTNSLKPYTISNDCILSNGTEWINETDSQIATIIYTKDLDQALGEDYTDNSLLVRIDLIAEQDITNIYEIFSVSNNFDDLEYGDANTIVKLSNKAGDELLYDYYVDQTAPVISGQNDYTVDEDTTLPDVLAGVTATDDYDFGVIEVVSDIDTAVDITTPGVYTVTLSAVDAFSNEGTVTVSITVTDLTPPVISGPDIYTYQLTADLPDYVNILTVTDNFDGDIILTVSNVDDSLVDYEVVGDYDVVYTVEDTSGNEATYTLTLEVIDTVLVSSVEFDEESMNIDNNETTLLEYEVFPYNALNRAVTFTSNNLSVVSVDSEGNITTHKSGTATIRVESQDTGVFDEIIVTVNLYTPELTLTSGVDTIYDYVVYSDPGCTVIFKGQNYQCTVESNDYTQAVGEYTITYYYYDSDNVKVYRYRVVKVISYVELGVIEVAQGIDTIFKGDTWIDPGCVTSGCTVISNNVNEDVVGTYEVVYQLSTDSRVTKTRYVNVYSQTPYSNTTAVIIDKRKEGDYLA